MPWQVRQWLGLRPGDRIEFVIEEGRTIIRPVRLKPDPFVKYAGVLRTFPAGRKEINKWLEDLRSEDDR